MNRWEPTELHFAQARCSGCKLLVSQPQASEQEMDDYYSRLYYQTIAPSAERTRTINHAAYLNYEIPMLERLWVDWPPPEGARVAEIGCGYGVLASVFKERGFRVLGCDVSLEALSFCEKRGIPAIRCSALSLPLAPGQFDVVLAFHVIEHLADPAAFTRALVELARPGGIVVVETEDAWNSQYAWDRFRARLMGRVPPFRSSTDHTFVFGAEHLRTMFVDSGCDLARVEVFDRVPPGESPHWRLYKGLFRNLDRLLGRGEYLLAVGRKAPAHS